MSTKKIPPGGKQERYALFNFTCHKCEKYKEDEKPVKVKIFGKSVNWCRECTEKLKNLKKLIK